MKESIQEKDKINVKRKKQGKINVISIIKNGVRFFASNGQLRGKYHHVPDLDSPISGTFVDGKLTPLADLNLYQERLETFRNKKVLPDAYAEEYNQDFRFYVFDPNTRIIEDTLGTNRETTSGPPKVEIY